MLVYESKGVYTDESVEIEKICMECFIIEHIVNGLFEYMYVHWLTFWYTTIRLY